MAATALVHPRTAVSRRIAACRRRSARSRWPCASRGSLSEYTEWANTPHGRYESFVLEVVHQMDTRFPTVPRRRFRAIGGLSEGAYGAVNIALHHLTTFGTAESWSGYYLQHRAGPFRRASLA